MDKWMNDEPLRGYDSAEASDVTAVETGSVTLVQQHFKDEVDVNTIVRRFGLTNVVPAAVAAGVYGDFTGIHDYGSAVAAIEKAEAGFMKLPAEVRDRFENDPARLIAFAQGSTEAEFLAAMEPPKPVLSPAVSPVPDVGPVVAPGS